MCSQATDLGVSVRGGAGNTGLETFLVAVADQMLISGASFWVGLYMARNFLKAEYGFYIMIITLSQILINYQNAVLNTPLLVLTGDVRPGYKAGAERLNFLLAGTIVLCACLGAVQFGISALAAAGFFGVFLVKEFRKNMLYAELDLVSLLRIDAMYLVFMGGALLAGVRVWWMIFPVMFAGHLLSLLLWRSGTSLFPGPGATIRNVVRDNRPIARWALVGVTATVLQNRSYVYMTSVLLSPEVLADLSVARMVMMPLALCVGSSGKVVVVLGRRALAGGDLQLFRRNVGLLMFALASTATCYIVLLLMAYPTLNEWIFQGRYDGLQHYIALWGGYFLVQMFRFVLSNSLQAMKKFRELALIGVVSGVLVPVLCLTLIIPLGGSGALVSVIGGEVVFLGGLAWAFMRWSREEVLQPESETQGGVHDEK